MKGVTNERKCPERVYDMAMEVFVSSPLSRVPANSKRVSSSRAAEYSLDLIVLAVSREVGRGSDADCEEGSHLLSAR